MTPRTVDEADLTPRALRRQRFGRVASGLNGGIFLIGAWDGFDTGAPLWSIAASGALGLVQLMALARSRRGPLPDRLAYGLAAAGMFVSALGVVHHHSGLPFAYSFAGLVNVALAVWGPERLRRIVRGPRA